MEKAKSPWAPSEAVRELEFLRRTLADAGDHIADFGEKNDITYDADRSPDSIAFHPLDGDFASIRAYAETVVHTINEMLEHHKKNFLFAVNDHENGFAIQAVNQTRLNP